MRMYNGSVQLEEELIQARIDEEYNRREEEYYAFLKAQDEEIYNAMLEYENRFYEDEDI